MVVVINRRVIVAVFNGLCLLSNRKLAVQPYAAKCFHNCLEELSQLLFKPLSYQDCSSVDFITLCFPDVCFERDVNIDPGYYNAPLTAVPNILTPTNCQILCRAQEVCQSFVWVIEKSICFMKTISMTKANIIRTVGLISGPPVCGKNYFGPKPSLYFFYSFSCFLI